MSERNWTASSCEGHCVAGNILSIDSGCNVHFKGTRIIGMPKLMRVFIFALFVIFSDSNPWALEIGSLENPTMGAFGSDEMLKINLQLHGFHNGESPGDKKWNPALKYALVAFTAGVGAILVYNGITKADRDACNEAEDRDTPCIGSTAVGFVVSGLVLSVVAIGIAKKF
jgi:hypothetical protein